MKGHTKRNNKGDTKLNNKVHTLTNNKGYTKRDNKCHTRSSNKQQTKLLIEPLKLEKIYSLFVNGMLIFIYLDDI